MYQLEPLPLDAIDDPELRALIADAETLGVPGADFARIIARSPVHAKPFLHAMIFSHTQGKVDHKLKEVIRLQLARFAEDPYFSALRSAKAEGLGEDVIDAGSGDYEDSPFFSEADKAALRYADQMYLDPSKVDGDFYAELKTHFSEAEIMELGSFIALQYGMQMFMRTLARKGAPPRR
jgi:alkylhydroperoxidase family enzyme